jgi:uncharacterized RDD family membrane protein YckC
MPTKNNIMSHNIAPLTRLLLSSLISLLIYVMFIYISFSLLSNSWEVISGKRVIAPHISFMSNYSQPAQNGYWLFIKLSILFIAIFSVFSPSFFGGTIGQIICGIRLVDEYGNKISLKQCILRSFWIVVSFLAISLPGPIIGFAMGQSANWLSLLSLIVASSFIIYKMLKRDNSGRAFLYRATGIYPVCKKPNGFSQ